jgi:hypothetical protein
MTRVASNRGSSEPVEHESLPDSDDEAGSTNVSASIHVDPSKALPTSSSKARAKRHIAALEDELEMMRQGRTGKQR